jgi:hypothetical protein
MALSDTILQAIMLLAGKGLAGPQARLNVVKFRPTRQSAEVACEGLAVLDSKFHVAINARQGTKTLLKVEGSPLRGGRVVINEDLAKAGWLRVDGVKLFDPAGFFLLKVKVERENVPPDRAPCFFLSVPVKLAGGVSGLLGKLRP